MVAGDVVNGNGGAINTALTFQPAATVEVCLMTYGVFTAWTFLTDGAVNARACFAIDNPAEYTTKLFINNTNYLYIEPQAGNTAVYSGIQIK